MGKTNIQGDSDIGTLESDTNKPVRLGGVARQTNPTAVNDGRRIGASFDDLGRQVTTPYQVRDLIRTAYVSLTTGAETTLLAGVAGVFFDLISVSASTDSTFGVVTLVPPYVTIRSTRGSGAVAALSVPGQAGTAVGAAGVTCLTLPVPLPQDETDSSWTIQLNDITGTTVNVQALFIRNV